MKVLKEIGASKYEKNNKNKKNRARCKLTQKAKKGLLFSRISSLKKEYKNLLFYYFGGSSGSGGCSTRGSHTKRHRVTVGE